ncbi:hypothetical protein F2Q69_00023122 [Brassica cretica]|uniref:Uncharacterized protein n=1 Tax=Brassica cretica TaxID=69181 RepID=A0A8S9QHE8_BRACR|nr:hypothetical protein F2Q69_00023122 [Brassica cretica]
MSIDEKRIPLRIERSKLAGSNEISRISIDTLVETSTDYSIGISIDTLGQALMRGLNMLTKLPRSAHAYSSNLNSVRMDSGFLDQLSPILAILAQLGWIQGEMQTIAYVYNS